jgi:AspT/YidE/YbjL antiporter-like protein
MDFLNSLLFTPSSIQAVIVLSIICAAGLALGKVRILGISLGVAFVFFVGIVAGHFGLKLEPHVLDYAESFGLILFVYALGLQVGPGFFSSFLHGGVMLNIWGLILIFVGTAFALLLGSFCSVSIPDMMGILCGATTNTPALGAAQQALDSMHISSSEAALGCAVTYPLGVIGVILAILFMKKLFVKPSDMEVHNADHNDTYIATYKVCNPALYGKTIRQLVDKSHLKFVISRLWRAGEVIVPSSVQKLEEDDTVLIVATEKEAEELEMIFGKKEEKDWNSEKIDWNSIDGVIESRNVVVSRPELNGKRMGDLQIRKSYGINISRVTRGDVKLLATYDLRLQYGDTLTVVGKKEALDNVTKFFGNTSQNLNEPNMTAIFIGMILGLVLGCIPIHIWGMTAPVRLGIAGGPILVGILVGTFGPRFHLITYTTVSANLMLRKLGLSLYLACLGISAGARFFEVVVRPEGLMWIGLGFLITFVPVVITGLILLKLRKTDFPSISGMLCGSMANPMALTYINDVMPGETASVSYATVYPISMFVRVIVVQVIVMFFV